MIRHTYERCYLFRVFDSYWSALIYFNVCMHPCRGSHYQPMGHSVDNLYVTQGLLCLILFCHVFKVIPVDQQSGKTGHQSGRVN